MCSRVGIPANDTSGPICERHVLIVAQAVIISTDDTRAVFSIIEQFLKRAKNRDAISEASSIGIPLRKPKARAVIREKMPLNFFGRSELCVDL